MLYRWGGKVSIKTCIQLLSFVSVVVSASTFAARPEKTLTYPVALNATYIDHKDGTITDTETGLMWQKQFQVMTLPQAMTYASKARTGGFDDWRVPSIKEMYSLIQFSGLDVSGRNMERLPKGAKPFIDTDYFAFEYGANGDRIIDTQYLTSTLYQGVTMGRNETVFGVNMADGRIKGYPVKRGRSGEARPFTVLLVRGDAYGVNQFESSEHGTVTDHSTGLMWAENDS